MDSGTTIYCSYVGFSNALGSSLPSPAGDFSASSLVMRMSSASTLPCNKEKWEIPGSEMQQKKSVWNESNDMGNSQVNTGCSMWSDIWDRVGQICDVLGPNCKNFVQMNWAPELSVLTFSCVHYTSFFCFVIPATCLCWPKSIQQRQERNINRLCRAHKWSHSLKAWTFINIPAARTRRCRSWCTWATSPWSSSAWKGSSWAPTRPSWACPASTASPSWRRAGSYSGRAWWRPRSRPSRSDPRPKPVREQSAVRSISSGKKCWMFYNLHFIGLESWLVSEAISKNLIRMQQESLINLMSQTVKAIFAWKIMFQNIKLFHEMINSYHVRTFSSCTSSLQGDSSGCCLGCELMLLEKFKLSFCRFYTTTQFFYLLSTEPTEKPDESLCRRSW